MATFHRTLGLFGYGAFGRFAAAHLRRDFDVLATDPRELGAAAREDGVAWAAPPEVAASEIVVLAVPVPALRPLLLEIAPRLRPDALVVEVCSVKQRPLELLEELLPEGVDAVGLHPMFGPQSGRDGIAGLKVVLCELRGGRDGEVERYLRDRLELEVIRKTPQQHDREMAYVQGLTHWMAKALREIPLPDPELATPAYRHLLAIEEILREDSDDLFLTIQRENPQVARARAELRRRLEEIERWIEERP